MIRSIWITRITDKVSSCFERLKPLVELVVWADEAVTVDADWEDVVDDKWNARDRVVGASGLRSLF